MTESQSILARRYQKDCFACRVTSGVGVIGISSYIFYHGKKRQNLGRYSMFGIASAACAVGVSRLFNLYPFNKRHQSDDD